MAETSPAAASTPRVVDSHAHLWSAARARRARLRGGPGHLHRAYFLTDLLAGVPESVTDIVLVEADREDADENQLLQDATEADKIATFVGRLDLHDPGLDVLAVLDAYPQLRGVRVVVDDRLRWGRVEANNAARLGRADRVVELLPSENRLPDVMTVARSAPDARFVVAHIGPAVPPGVPQESWWDWVYELATIPNVYAKVSRVPERSAADATDVVDRLLTGFGVSRLMVGTNWPVFADTLSYAESIEALRCLAGTLTQHEQLALLSGTAHELGLARGCLHPIHERSPSTLPPRTSS